LPAIESRQQRPDGFEPLILAKHDILQYWFKGFVRRKTVLKGSIASLFHSAFGSNYLI